ICSNQARRNLPSIELPNRSYSGPSSIGCTKFTFDFKTWSETSFLGSGDFVLASMLAQCIGKRLPYIFSNSELAEERCFARTVTMPEIEEIIGNLLLLDDEQIRMRRLHFAAASTILISSGVIS